MNLHLRSGGGATDDGGTLTGLGNLVIGYNEPSGGQNPGDRDGSHNLVVGTHHRYLSWGGFVAGFSNFLSGPAASVTGGQGNGANGDFASVSGGVNNAANGPLASVSGGDSNRANGNAASVSGGFKNTADGIRASVSGGATRTAPGTDDWRAGGLFQDN